MTVVAGGKTIKPDEKVLFEYDEQYIQKFATQMLNLRVFKGVYSERRWVEPLQEFREIVVVNHLGNEELLNHLTFVKKRLREFYGDNKWIGITVPNCVGAPAGYCLWLKPWNKPFGEHLFSIRNVIFSEREICLSVKSKKLLDTKTTEQPKRNENSAAIGDSKLTNLTDLGDKEKLLENLFSTLTAHNLTAALKCLFFTFAALFTFLLTTIQWLGEFTLRFMREFSNLVQALMPLLLAIVECAQKTIGGFYLLLAMMYRSWKYGDEPPPRLPPVNPEIYGIRPSSSYKQHCSSSRYPNRSWPRQ